MIVLCIIDRLFVIICTTFLSLQIKNIIIVDLQAKRKPAQLKRPRLINKSQEKEDYMKKLKKENESYNDRRLQIH